MALDVLDLITAEEAAAALNAQGGASPVSLQADAMAALITAVSRSVDAKCGPVVHRTVTSELHDGSDWRDCRVSFVALRKPPVSSVTTATEYTGIVPTTLTVETNATKPTNGFLVDRFGNLHRRASGSEGLFPSGAQNVSVTYVAGRYATTATVDAKFKEAAQTLFAHWWRAEHGVGSRFGDADTGFGVTATGIPTFGWPRAVQDLLLDQLLVPGVA